MYCTNCGKKITDEAMFCPFCGAPTLPDLIKPEEPAGEPVSVNEPVRSGVTVRVGKSTLDLVQIVERLAGIVGFLLLLPLMINAVSNVLGFITYTLIRPMIFARKAIIWIVRILSLAELLGLGYLIFTERYRSEERLNLQQLRKRERRSRSRKSDRFWRESVLRASAHR